jgi:hypothetical protein
MEEELFIYLEPQEKNQPEEVPIETKKNLLINPLTGEEEEIRFSIKEMQTPSILEI